MDSCTLDTNTSAGYCPSKTPSHETTGGRLDQRVSKASGIPSKIIRFWNGAGVGTVSLRGCLALAAAHPETGPATFVVAENQHEPQSTISRFHGPYLAGHNPRTCSTVFDPRRNPENRIDFRVPGHSGPIASIHFRIVTYSRIRRRLRCSPTAGIGCPELY